MARRGRPPYPEILTPREQEVHKLLREGLSNAEIAERMGISMDGAKYHVSEIMSKLDVGSRQEAAGVRLEAVRPWWATAFAPVAFLWRTTGAVAPVNLSSAALVVSGGLLVAVVGGLGLIAFLLMRGGEAGPTPSANDEFLDQYDFRSFGESLDEALRSGDLQFFADNVVYEDIECGEAHGPPGMPRNCAGLPVGSTAQAVPAGTLNSGGTYYDPGQYAELIQGLFKSYAPELYAFGARSDRFRPERYDEYLENIEVIVAGLLTPGDVSGAEIVLFGSSFDGENWRITHLTLGGPPAFLDPADPLLEDFGFEDFFEFWERWEQ